MFFLTRGRPVITIITLVTTRIAATTDMVITEFFVSRYVPYKTPPAKSAAMSSAARLKKQFRLPRRAERS